MTDAIKVTDVEITPVAIQDPPLLNSEGVHQPYALRAIIQVHTDAGLTGLGEAYGDDPTLANLRAAAALLPGLEVFDLNGLTARITAATAGGAVNAATPTELIGGSSVAKAIASAVAAFETPLLDLQGKALGRPVVDLLGGRARDAVPYSAYLFYRWADHPADPGYRADEDRLDDWGAAVDPDGIVAQARRMTEQYGFGSLKLKAGVFEPEQEIEALVALRKAFPDHPLRIDPNANWTPETALRLLPELEPLLEYLEDPVPGRDGMAQVAAATSLPLATNMCVTAFEDIPEAVALGSVAVVLGDHHFWGGLRASQRLAGICETFGLGMSMHSNTHLGISLAAMTHLAAATPHLTYACDTHYPWLRDKARALVKPGALRFVDGAVPVPDAPGLGVELDLDVLAELHEDYLRCGIRRRDDVSAMRVAVPDWSGKRPRF